MKVCAEWVVIRDNKKGGAQIHTQTRHVIHHEYDWLYDNTEESGGELLEPWENIIEAVVRGCQEELGAEDFVYKKIIGADGKVFSTRQGEDKILGLEPYYFTQQLQGPQPWIGLCFVVVVPSNFEPKPDKEGEVSAHKWWDPKTLLKELRENPRKFMGLDYPFLIKVCEDIIQGKIKV